MADEAEEGGGGAAPGGGGGSVLKKYGPLALIVLLAQVVLAYVVIVVALPDKMGGQEPDEPLIPEEQISEDSGGEESGELPFYFKSADLQGITANPAGTNAQRYAVLSVELGLAGEKDGEAISRADMAKLAAIAEATGLLGQQMGLVKSIILGKLRASYIDDLENNLDGILDELKDDLNQRVFNRVKWDDDNNMKIRVTGIISTALVIQ